MTRRTAVLLLAHGAAESVAEVPQYLASIFGARPVDEKLVREIQERYILIGGKSPLAQITAAQAAGLQAELERREPGAFRVFVGMRNSRPRVAEAVARVKSEGFDSIVPVPMTPYRSALSTGAYLEQFRAAANDAGLKLREFPVESWCTQPALITGLARTAREAAARAPKGARVLFTAHSLPARIEKTGDPYPAQLRATAQAVAAAAGIPDWEFAYQSAGRTPEPWLGPDAGERIAAAAAEGAKALMLAPIGFISDHMETLYDVDIQFRRQAEKLGLTFERAATLNAAPELVTALADAVMEKVPA